MSPLDVLRLVARVLEWALPFVPSGELAAHLSVTARKIDDAIADLAQAAKFGS